MQIENENSFRKYLKDGINLFLGAGFSIHATGTYEDQPKLLPVGDILRLEILKSFNRDLKSAMELPQLCQVISGTQRDELKEFLKNRFKVISFDAAYKNLERVSIKSIFTTNIDSLIFKIFEESNKYYINDVALRGPSIAGLSGIDYVALHGSVLHAPSQGFDFSPVEIASSFERDKDKWFSYITRVQHTPTLYWGYKLRDAGVLQALSKETANGRNRSESWVTLTSNDPEAIEYYKSLGFQIIIGDTLELLKYFGQLSLDKSVGKSKRLIDKRFPEYFIPAVVSVPVRKISEFYLGAEPSWYDVFLGDLHKTNYFSTIKDKIFGGKNCIMTGGAVTGKSTLLKLLANTISEAVQVLFIEEISPEKARLLKNDIDAEGVVVVIFIDNAADAWEAIAELVKSTNIQIVAAERDYIFDSVSHRFPRSTFEILDVSGLFPSDVQAVRTNIPLNIKKNGADRSRRHSLYVDFDPTFYEVLETSTKGHILTDRFIDALGELKIESIVKHDLLLLSCYLYSCRVPTSVDVAGSFIHKYVSNVATVYDLLESMTTLLSRYEGSLASTDQAYFVPRSRSVAEAVIKRVNPNLLKDLLVRFHENISTTKIPRYDIFRRMAYDANLTLRAFNNWQEGLEFYEACAKRDPSHSLKQQGALYLLRKKQHALAFKWIDEAMAIAGQRGASVRNTYAVILFSANYDKSSEDGSVVETLDESMQILQQCYTDDLKKIYHAKVFADQSIKYSEKFPTSNYSLEYIELATDWLRVELDSRRGDRSITQLLGKLKTAKRNIAF